MLLICHSLLHRHLGLSVLTQAISMRKEMTTSRLTCLSGLHALARRYLMLHLSLLITSIRLSLIRVKSSSAALIVKALMIRVINMVLLILKKMGR